MKKTTIALTMLSAGLITLSACTAENQATNLPPGKYEKTTKSTDANGTDVTRKQTTDVTVDQYGRKTAVVSEKKTTDPKGLFNKNTSQSKEVIQER